MAERYLPRYLTITAARHNCHLRHCHVRNSVVKYPPSIPSTTCPRLPVPAVVLEEKNWPGSGRKLHQIQAIYCFPLPAVFCWSCGQYAPQSRHRCPRCIRQFLLRILPYTEYGYTDSEKSETVRFLFIFTIGICMDLDGCLPSVMMCSRTDYTPVHPADNRRHKQPQQDHPAMTTGIILAWKRTGTV